MADIDVSGGGGGHKKGPGVKKAKKLSTRVDMTPMVDLGFLLITFFIFTTTLSTPSTMALTMPKENDDPENQTEVKESAALTVLLGKGDQVYYYMGQIKPDGSNFLSSNFKDIRKIISEKKKEVIANYVANPLDEKIKLKAKESGDPNWMNAAYDKDFVVIIKPNEEATYKNTVDMLDEMTINDVKRFAMVDITEDENKLIHATEKNSSVK